MKSNDKKETLKTRKDSVNRDKSKNDRREKVNKGDNTIKSGSRSKCSEGEILRNSYKAERNGKIINVPSTCITDRGLVGKTPKSRIIKADLSKHDLKSYGYTDVKNLSADKRHTALLKATKEEGSLPIQRKLNLLSILQRNTNPALSSKFIKDRDWLKKNAI